MKIYLILSYKIKTQIINLLTLMIVLTMALITKHYLTNQLVNNAILIQINSNRVIVWMNNQNIHSHNNNYIKSKYKT